MRWGNIYWNEHSSDIRWSQIYSFMDRLKSMSDSNEIEVIDKSTEGRDLKVLKIGELISRLIN